ncbi:hypothetical protein QFC19_000702 [Naganishia cerealis]|uniref:Uncharacterized protein n=1 Tax=Naganishia cerealis TaxID=610337 RepID=A0ACC2WKL6_9TREE|nr:hypothetical protein QFC19_000702 [Naganishia cerealis]
MSERGRGGNRGGGKPRGGGRGGGAGAGGGGGQQTERKPREAILDLGRFVDKEIRVKFQGGREVVGVLKGYDQLQNLVLDEVREEPTGKLTSTCESAVDRLKCIDIPRRQTEGRPGRKLGLVVLRGPTIVVISPVEGYEEVANPFVQAE